MGGISTPGEAAEHRQYSEQADRHISSNLHSISPQSNSAVILSLNPRRQVDNAQSAQIGDPDTEACAKDSAR
jgi:hypothetical protein